MTEVGTPKTPIHTDSDESSDDEVVECTTIERIGWMPAYDIAYVKCLEYDRALQNSREVRHEEIVRHCQFQMEANHEYHLGILQTNEQNERRIERLMQDLE